MGLESAIICLVFSRYRSSASDLSCLVRWCPVRRCRHLRPHLQGLCWWPQLNRQDKENTENTVQEHFFWHAHLHQVILLLCCLEMVLRYFKRDFSDRDFSGCSSLGALSQHRPMSRRIEPHVFQYHRHVPIFLRSPGRSQSTSFGKSSILGLLLGILFHNWSHGLQPRKDHLCQVQHSVRKSLPRWILLAR